MRRILYRLHHALGPLAAGIILDALDLATFGPIGLVAGMFIGGYVGWVLAGLEGFDVNGKIMLSALAGLYMTIPFTEPLPIATIMSVGLRYFKAPVPDEGGESELEIDGEEDDRE